MSWARAWKCLRRSEAYRPYRLGRVEGQNPFRPENLRARGLGRSLQHVLSVATAATVAGSDPKFKSPRFRNAQAQAGSGLCIALLLQIVRVELRQQFAGSATRHATLALQLLGFGCRVAFLTPVSREGS